MGARVTVTLPKKGICNVGVPVSAGGSGNVVLVGVGVMVRVGRGEAEIIGFVFSKKEKDKF